MLRCLRCLLLLTTTAELGGLVGDWQLLLLVDVLLGVVLLADQPVIEHEQTTNAASFRVLASALGCNILPGGTGLVTSG